MTFALRALHPSYVSATEEGREKAPILLKIEPRFLGRRARRAVAIPTEPSRALFIMTTIKICNLYKTRYVGRDSSVGIATRYGLDGPGIESR